MTSKPLLIKAPLCRVCGNPLDAVLFAEDGLDTHPCCEPPNPSKEL
jgi:hypothetical protein